MPESKASVAKEVKGSPLSRRSIVLYIAMKHAMDALQMLEKDSAHDIETMATSPIRCAVDNLRYLYEQECIKETARRKAVN